MKYREGQIVRFKSWNEMEKEFGTDTNGDIPCKFTFVKDMKILCNKEFKIERISEINNKLIGHYKDIDGYWIRTGYSISTDMVKILNQNRRIITS